MTGVSLVNIDQDQTWLALKDASLQDLVRTIPAEQLQIEVEKTALTELTNQVSSAIQTFGYTVSDYPTGAAFRKKAAKVSRLCQLLAAVLEHNLTHNIVTDE